jgi:hypothetical protein
MSSILKNNLSKIFYILLILVSYILSEKSYTTIDLGKGNEFYLDKEEDLKVLNFSEYDYYKITIEKKLKLVLYLIITITYYLFIRMIQNFKIEDNSLKVKEK